MRGKTIIGRMCAFALGLSIIIGETFANGVIANAESTEGYDTIAPVINTIRFTGETSVPRSTEDTESYIHVEMDVTENGTGVSQVDFNFVGVNGITNFNTTESFETYNTTGTLGIDVLIPTSTKEASYYIQQIMIYDGAGNSNEYFCVTPDYNDIGTKKGLLLSGSSTEGCVWADGSENTFAVVGNGDVTAPNVISVEFKETTASRGSDVSIYVDAIDESEIKSINIFMYNVEGDYDPNRAFSLSYDSSDGEKTEDGRYIVTGFVFSGSMVCDYAIGGMLISDSEYNEIRYDWDSDNARYYTYDDKSYIQASTGEKCEIKDGAVLSVTEDGDAEAPKVTSISIREESVTKPGVVNVDFYAEDEEGVSQIFVYLYNKDGDGMVGGQTTYEEKVTSIESTVKISVPTTATAGEYFIGQINVYDFNLNVREYYFDSVNNAYYVDESSNSYLSDSCGEKAYVDNGTVAIEEEFDVAFEVSLSNAELVSMLENMDEGKTAKVLLDGVKTASQNLFEAIKGKDKTIVFYHDNYQWVFNGKDITQSKDIDLQIDFSLEAPSYGSEDDLLKISFADNGILPGKAKIRIKSDYTFQKLDLNKEVSLYFLNGSVPEIVEDANISDMVLDGTDHWCEFSILHNSEYLLSSEELGVEPVGYAISYNTNGGSFVEDVENIMEIPDPLPTTEKLGYSFEGWYLDEGLRNKAIPGMAINESITLYARWARIECTTHSYIKKDDSIHECSECGIIENHDFSIENAILEGAKISDATCVERAKYYKSCECGEVSSDDEDVFYYGELGTHDLEISWSSDDTGHWKVCKTEGCDVKDSIAKHSYAPDTNMCICGKENPNPSELDKEPTSAPEAPSVEPTPSPAIPVDMPTTTPTPSVKIGFNNSKIYINKGTKVGSKFYSDGKKVTYTSSDKNIITVDKNGKITAKKTGKAKITAKVGSKKYTCTVYVYNPSISGKAKVKKGKSITLKVKDGHGKTTWTSSNSLIATVDKNGKVKGKKKGTVTITAVNNGKKIKKKITVN